MANEKVHVEFPGRIIFIGFGSIGQGTLPLVLRHIGTPKERITIITSDDRGKKVADEYGIKHVKATLTRDNYQRELDAHIGRGDFVLNVSVDVSSIALIKYCWSKGAMYLDTCIEPWPGGYTDVTIPHARRTNYALREEALAYPAASGEKGACVFGGTARVKSEKAVVANSAAVREWDSNGTNFGYNPARNHTAGEFGHNDFYPVVVAACQELGLDGKFVGVGVDRLDYTKGIPERIGAIARLLRETPGLAERFVFVQIGVPSRSDVPGYAEIAAEIQEEAFDDLDAPIERVTGENAPMPYAKNLEHLKTPSKAKIAAAIRRVCSA